MSLITLLLTNFISYFFQKDYEILIIKLMIYIPQKNTLVFLSFFTYFSLSFSLFRVCKDFVISTDSYNFIIYNDFISNIIKSDAKTRKHQPQVIRKKKLHTNHNKIHHLFNFPSN